jgi:DNA-binding SARP family transcriptional activator
MPPLTIPRPDRRSAHLRPELTLRVVGEFEVYRGHRVLPAAKVGSRKARWLLAFAALQFGYVPTEKIVTALWGSVPPRDPEANVATLVSRLRLTLGPDSIMGGRTGYRLGDHVRVDLVEATHLISEAEARIAGGYAAAALAAGKQALHLLDNGAVLAEVPEADWAEPARASHHQLLRRARRSVAEAALQTGDIQTAQAAAEGAMAADTLDEAACRLVMRAHHAAGEPARALLAYHRLHTALTLELGVDPAASTRELHVALLQDMHGSTP